jgi:hypothetical protein
MRIALLSYRSKTHCGGQGVYVRHLARGLVELGHDVEVFSGQPYPEVLDPRVRLTKVPSLDLYREPDPFRIPRPSEIRDRIDMLELLTTWTAGFPEPRTFTMRAARLLAERLDDFDVIHDNQSLGTGLLTIAELVCRWWRPCTIRSRGTGSSTWRPRTGGESRWCVAGMGSPRCRRRLPARSPSC